MDRRKKFTEDEHDVNFSDTTLFACKRWTDAVEATKELLSPADREKTSAPRDWQKVLTDTRTLAQDAGTSPSTRQLLNQIIPFPRTLANLIGAFNGAVNPQQCEFNIMWGLLDLNIKLSMVSSKKLGRITGWIKKYRSVLELFNRCLEAFKDDMNEARYAMVDVLEQLLSALGQSATHFRDHPSDIEATKAWRPIEVKMSEALTEMEAAVKQLNDITSFSQANQERRAQTLVLRHAPALLPEEPGTFPVDTIPRSRNEEFYGRKDELESINSYLDWRDNPALRTYTIYGRRGVGKTVLALEYAHSNPSRFDAIFWVQCETAALLRASFSDIAVALELPGAEKTGRHEENLLLVHKWLKTTKRRWLLIFDNAERETVMKGYWPVGANGAILITSRKYHNFTNDAQRRGDTVKPFNDRQAWNLLMKLLGPEWEELDRKGLIKGSEESAAKELLRSLGGLALAVQQAAQLIKNTHIGGHTIVSTLESFKDHRQKLPPRPAKRSDIIHSLDSLWSMTFSHLSRNARDLLSVLAFLSPDRILIDLFLPKNQRALDGKLSFCKQSDALVDPGAQLLFSVITAPHLLNQAIEELVGLKLIGKQSRELWVHREVQEAMNYDNGQELQAYFDAAAAVVYEAFPKQIRGDHMSSRSSACEAYISHAAHLSFVFATLNQSGAKNTLKGSREFIDLLANAAWYLYEVSDYDICLRLVETGQLACEDDESLQYANLCNAAGAAYYELNKLKECRQNFETFEAIQDKLLPEDDQDRSKSLHNMGNIETISDNLSEATEYFKRAISIRINGGDAASNLLATSYLCMSRVHYLQLEYDEAFNMLAQAEALFFRTSGGNAPLMAHVHFWYGNIDYAQKRWVAAKRSYDTSLKIALYNHPIHPITAAAYYSLGCVEFERKNYENAKSYLDKALAIAQLRSPARDDGTMARILWKMSVVLENDTFGTYHKEANEMRIRAEVAMRALTSSGEGRVVTLDEDGNADAGETEDLYDSLVPGFFR